ncbi:MAG: hypothetical protein P4L33_01615 [Capsulimonadaceae bacterium]|nr:hypothetical protein [Capsulimonadaceae bacterium]
MAIEFCRKDGARLVAIVDVVRPDPTTQESIVDSGSSNEEPATNSAPILMAAPPKANSLSPVAPAERSADSDQPERCPDRNSGVMPADPKSSIAPPTIVPQTTAREQGATVVAPASTPASVMSNEALTETAPPKSSTVPKAPRPDVSLISIVVVAAVVVIVVGFFALRLHHNKTNDRDGAISLSAQPVGAGAMSATATSSGPKPVAAAPVSQAKPASPDPKELEANQLVEAAKESNDAVVAELQSLSDQQAKGQLSASQARQNASEVIHKCQDAYHDAVSACSVWHITQAAQVERVRSLYYMGNFQEAKKQLETGTKLFPNCTDWAPLGALIHHGMEKH